MQQKWISGKEILESQKIQGIELFRLVKEGLEPHDDLLRLKPTPDIVEKTKQSEKIKKKLGEYEVICTDYGEVGYDADGMVCHAEEFEYTSKDISREEYESLKTKSLNLKLYLDKNNSWAEYKLPDDKEAAISVVADLVNSLYSYDDEILIKYRHNEDNLEISNSNAENLSNERTEANELIWNGSSWEITFEGQSLKETFKDTGIKAIAHIIQHNDNSINPVKLAEIVSGRGTGSGGYDEDNDDAADDGVGGGSYGNDDDDDAANGRIASNPAKIMQSLLKQDGIHSVGHFYGDYSNEDLQRIEYTLVESSKDTSKIDDVQVYIKTLREYGIKTSKCKNSTYKCELYSINAGINSDAWKKARKSQNGNIENAINKIDNNMNCNNLASHFRKHIFYCKNKKAFVYTGGYKWYIKF
jgi:hypothetical protein